jgi:2-alkyl-3-oxoalkanoate reductase
MSKQEFQVLVLGRGVYALPILRILGTKSQDFDVHVTFGTSVGFADIGSCSKFVDSVVKIPRPDHDLEAFTVAVCAFARGKPNLVIVPIAEETIFLSQIAIHIQEACAPNKARILCSSSPEILVELNEKYQFQKHMAKIFSGKRIPRTNLVHNKEDLLVALKAGFEKKSAPAVVMKPLLGHGGLGAHIIKRADFESSSPEELMRRVEYTGEHAYVVQEFVEGLELSTYSLCKDGEVVAHLCYIPRNVSTHGFSPIRTMATPAKWKSSLAYVQKVASVLKLTGHFGFDFMERFNGELVALECNPRVTNGIAFFSPRFSSAVAKKMQLAYLGFALPDGIIAPIAENPLHVMTLLPAISCIAKSKSSGESLALLEVAVLSYDDIWWWNDPLPFFSTVLRLVSVLAYSIWVVLTGKGQSISQVVKELIVDEIIEFDKITEKSMQTKVENVGGFEETTPSRKKGEKGLKVLVTGATGFLGGRIVQILNQGYEDGTALPSAAVSVSVITATGRDEKKGQSLVDSLEPKGKARFVKADLSDAEETFRLVQGHDVVIHSAALCALWTRWDDYISANVTAAQNIVHACHQSGTVRLLVHISSPSLCISVDTDDRLNCKEDDPLPSDKNQPNRYAASKKMAEAIVLDVATRYSLPCIVLRPRAIFGPGDTTLFPVIVDRLQQGRLPIVGGKGCVGDFTYVDNVVYACLCCLDKTPESAKIYSITNDDPRLLWDVIEKICDALKLKRPRKRVPRWVAYYAACVCEGVAVVCLLSGYEKDPLLTRYTVNVLSRSSTFDIAAAKKDLGYKAIVPFDDGVRRFLNSISSGHEQ